jgi:ABC-type transport system involved in multi-copper enzyme maturation permease subunit
MVLLQISYLKKIWYDQRYVLIALVISSALFEYLYAWVFFRSPISSFIEAYFKFLPVEITSFLGVQAGTAFYHMQMLAFGYAHPLILISLSFLPISMPARYISGEIESKNFDIFFSRPIHRSVVPIHLFIFITAATAIQVVAIVSGTLVANVQFSLALNIGDYARVAIAAFFFYLSMAAMALTIASFQNERGKALSKIIGIVVFFYFYDTITRLNESLKSYLTFSYFRLYQPGEIILHKTSLIQGIFICVLLVILFLAIAILQFNRRDL